MAKQSARRAFMKSAAAAGFLGALGRATEASAEPPQQVTPAVDTARPNGLGAHAMLDNRFPVSYEHSVPEGVRVITQYFSALSRRDLRGMADLLHFPFGTFEGTEPVVVESADQFMTNTPASMNVSTNPERYSNHDGYMKPGCYDVFAGIEVINSDSVHAGLAMTYNRYDSNGKKLLRCQGVYCVSNNDGKWAIQLMSTIFTPADMIHVTFTDTIEAAKRVRINHDLAYQVSDRSVDRGTPQLGKRLTSSGGSGTGAIWQAGPAGTIMDHYKVKGIKSRLVVSDVTEESLAKQFMPSANPISDYAAYRALFPQSGVGNWGWVYGVLPETRVLHATFDKAHMFSGAIRFTTAGDECSHNADLSVITYRKGHWGMAGGLTYTTPHDRSNDVKA
jgi:hypothetical protein